MVDQNRINRWITSEDGSHSLEYKADPRHAETTTEQLGLDGSGETKPLSTTNTKDAATEFQQSKVSLPLVGAKARPHRSATMRLKYLAAKPRGLGICNEECARLTLQSTAYSLQKLKKVKRYWITILSRRKLSNTKCKRKFWYTLLW